MKRLFPFVCVLVGAFLALAACAPSPSTPTAFPTSIAIAETPDKPENPVQPTAEDTTAYPYPLPQTNDSYPAPEVAAEPYVPEPIPTRLAGATDVKGTVLLNGVAVYNKLFYLAPIIPDENGRDVVAALDVKTSPHAISDPQGGVMFYNVVPGRYGLILDTIRTSYLLHYPVTNKQIVIEVVADQVFDLGVVDFETLPIAAP